MKTPLRDQVLSALVLCASDYPAGMTRREIRLAREIHEDVDIGRRVREIRTHYDLTIICDTHADTRGQTEYRYRIAAADMPKARDILQKIKPSTASQMLNGLESAPSSTSSAVAASPSVATVPEVRS